MTIAIANVALQNTFGHWIQRTNEMAAALSTIVLTAGGNTTIGNVALQGVMSTTVLAANTITAQTGNVTVSSANLVVDTTGSLYTVGPVQVQGTLTISTISNVQIPGAANNANFLCANVSSGNLYFAEVLIPSSQLTDFRTTNGTFTNTTILIWSGSNSTNGFWVTGSIANIAYTNIANLAVGVVSSPLTVANSAAIANTVFVLTTNRVGVNTTSPRTTVDVNGVIWATGDISGFQTSDETQKENVETIDPAEAFSLLMKARPVEFDWTTLNKSLYRAPWNVGHDTGLIAQEWQKIFPTHVHKRPDGTLAVDYTKSIPYILASLQYLGSKVSQ
jgi:hypothetical protein